MTMMDMNDPLKISEYSKEAVWLVLQQVCYRHLEKYLTGPSTDSKRTVNHSLTSQLDRNKHWNGDHAHVHSASNTNKSEMANENESKGDHHKGQNEIPHKKTKSKRFFKKSKKSKQKRLISKRKSHSNADEHANANTAMDTNTHMHMHVDTDGDENGNADEDGNREGDVDANEDDNQQDWSELTFSFSQSVLQSTAQFGQEDAWSSSVHSNIKMSGFIDPHSSIRPLPWRTPLLSSTIGQRSQIKMFDSHIGTEYFFFFFCRKRKKWKVSNWQRDKRNGNWELIEMSPFHITTLFSTVIDFVNQAHIILGIANTENEEKKEKSGHANANTIKNENENKWNLKNYVNTFVQTIFIQEMQAHINGELGLILSEENQIDYSVEIVFVKANDYVFQLNTLQQEWLTLPKSASQIYRLTERVFTTFRQLPMFDPNAFVGIVTQILTGCRETYQWAFTFEIKPRLVSISLAQTNKQMLPDRIDLQDFIRYLSNFTLRKLLYTTRQQAIFKEKITIGNNYDPKLEYRIFQELADEYQKQWTKREDGEFAIFNMNVYSQLSLLCTGLYWISQKLQRDQIFLLRMQSQQNSIDHMHPTSRGSFSKSSGNNVCDPLERYLIDNFEPLCEFYLVIIRVELRAQCTYFLTHIANQSYVLYEPSKKPQGFIIDLNKLLIKAEFELNQCLPEHLVKFLFLELSYFLYNVLVQLIINIQHKRINKLGAKQLRRNIFSLQQTLTTITQKPQDKTFQKLHHFLELSQKTLEEIENFRQTDNKMFNEYELDTIVKIAKLNM
ncbi:hypothetical protein RFI_27950 [Reticulomyxa filosa]|uniref:Exocyst complex component Sec8 n=1 Tax=Reticulomyxa filosa TaxID=46433 RepID=X6M619_RETFI|nr:hypothetical protein RFI_27950 [Reticulomyxa filosa]|eukprot:ETO09428.1 hypothetical protein RFI_27950 [Reticulomyxa filosa]